jgi:hypothetical protein
MADATAARTLLTEHLGAKWTVRGIDEPFAGTKLQASRPKLLNATMWCFARSAGSLMGGCFARYAGEPYDAPDISAQTRSNKGGVWQMPDPYSDIDTFVHEIHEPIKEEDCN